MKRFLSLFISFCLIFGCFSSMVLADTSLENEEPVEMDAGSVEDAGAGPFTITEDGVLTDYSGSKATIFVPDGVVRIENFVFQDDKNLKTVYLPDSLKEIGDYAFRDCSNLMTINLPDGLTKIGDSAFTNCKKMLCTIPDTVESIGELAFYDCENLRSIHISDKITVINYGTFALCKNVSSVTLGKSIEKIGEDAFREIPLWVEDLVLPEPLVDIEDFAFYGCEGLTSVTMGDNVTEVGVSAFANNKSLSSVKLSNSLVLLGARAFSGDELLTSVTLPESMKSMEQEVFANCPITTLTIPDAVEMIVPKALASMTALEEVFIGNGVTSIGNEAFADCTSLKTLCFAKKLQSYGQDLFTNCDTDSMYAYVYDETKAIDLCEEYGIAYTIVDKRLDPVENLTAAPAGKNKVKLSWDPVEGAVGYLIYAKKDGKYAYVGMTTKGTTFTDKNALDKDYNYYFVYPYEYKDGSVWAGKGAPYVYAKGICPAVTNLKASALKGKVKLSWTASPDAEGYLIYGIRPNGSYGYIGMTTKGTTYTDTKASAEDYNFYWVFPFHKDADGKVIAGLTGKYTYGRAR